MGAARSNGRDGWAPLLGAQERLLSVRFEDGAETLQRSVDDLCAGAAMLEAQGHARETILGVLTPSRALFARSPLVARLQTWPRGYAGDFQTIELLSGAVNHAEPGTVAWRIEQMALSSPIAMQHRHKLRRQADALVRLQRSGGGRAILLACGGGRDLEQLREQGMRLDDVHLVLVDQDRDALSLADDRATRLGARTTCMALDVLRALRQVRGLAHLVVAGGLLDYLPARTARAVLAAARRRLAEGGCVLVTNIARGNPYRYWIEYLGDWCLQERTRDDLRSLLAEAGFDPHTIATDPDPTGLAIIATARTPEANARRISECRILAP